MNRFFILLLLSSLAFCEEYHQWVDFGGLPSGTVAGCVNVMTGDLTFNHDDLIVRGHEPIIIKRRYTTQYDMFDLHVGWKCGFNHLEAKVYFDHPGGLYATLLVPEKMGLAINYQIKWVKAQEKISKGKKAFYKLDKEKGKITNSALGELSARNNPLNNIVYHKPSDIKEIIVEGPDGAQRHYRTKESIHELHHRYPGVLHPWIYYLAHETLPNGNILHYCWEKEGQKRRLTRVNSCSPSGKVFAWVEFSYPSEQCTHIKTSDGRTLTYTDRVLRKKKLDLSLLSTVEGSDRPTEIYRSYWGDESIGAYVASIHLPNGRIREFKRYQVGWNEEANVHIKKEEADKHPLYKRIRKILDPIGDGGALRVSYRFEYSPGEYEKSGGFTKVFDPHGNWTQYHYNRSFWLTSIQHHWNSGQLLFTENYDWYDKGWLRTNSIADREGKPFVAKQYQYDGRGNVEHEWFWGNHSGNVPGGLAYQGSHVVSNGSEGYHIAREYNDKNLLTKETFPEGTVVEYSYLEDTNLLSLKRTCYPEGLYQREFYQYDDSICIKEVIDDGTGKNIQDLTGVTERRLKVIIPKQGDFYGLPERIKEGYYDLRSGHEVILKEQGICYNPRGLVEKILHYDAEGNYCYSLEYFYNGQDRLIAQKDPLGRKRTIDYDENGNILIDDDPNENYSVQKTYDFANRPCTTTYTGQDGIKRSHSLRYNLLSQKITEMDHQGNSIHFSYDPLNRPLTVLSSPIYDETGHESIPILHKQYNPLGEIELEIDAEGNQTHYLLTSRGKPYQIIHPDGCKEYLT